jgi:hypothetical protein
MKKSRLIFGVHHRRRLSEKPLAGPEQLKELLSVLQGEINGGVTV